VGHCSTLPVLAVLAEFFVGQGAEFCTLVVSNNGVGFGLSKLVRGWSWSLLRASSTDAFRVDLHRGSDAPQAR
jgi:hypothetical protein